MEANVGGQGMDHPANAHNLGKRNIIHISARAMDEGFGAGVASVSVPGGIVTTVRGHRIVTGDKVFFEGVAGMTQLANTAAGAYLNIGRTATRGSVTENKSIADITLGIKTVIVFNASHMFVVGDYALIEGVAGNIGVLLNNIYYYVSESNNITGNFNITIQRLANNTLEALNSTDYPAFVSGGTVRSYRTFQIESTSGYTAYAAQAITFITQDTLAVVTYTGSDVYANGDHIYIDNLSSGPTALNGRTFTISSVDTTANTFSIGTDTTSYPLYSSSGGSIYATANRAFETGVGMWIKQRAEAYSTFRYGMVIEDTQAGEKPIAIRSAGLYIRSYAPKAILIENSPGVGIDLSTATCRINQISGVNFSVDPAGVVALTGINADSFTATCTGNTAAAAVTLNYMAGFITTVILSNLAAGVAHPITFTNSKFVAGDMVFLTLHGTGSCTARKLMFETSVVSGKLVIKIYNNEAAPISGTLVFQYLVVKQ
jgi:hypothetical protein